MKNNLKLIYGTTNPAKLSTMKNALKSLPIEIVGLSELGAEIPDVAENGNSPLENASAKARAYFDFFKVPVFSCDSGLFFDEVAPSELPGVNVRTVDGKRLSDDEMLAHYSALAKKYGRLTAHYENAICLAFEQNNIVKTMTKTIDDQRFYIVPKPHEKRRAGFPLDSLSVEIASGKYFYDLEKEQKKDFYEMDDFVKFFEEVLKINIE